MYLEVLLQVASARELLLTVIASEWLLTRVDALVAD